MADSIDLKNHGLAPAPIIVKEPPKFDLESHISNYDGLTRLDRLIAIGTASTAIGTDALRLALAEAQKGKNVDTYLDIGATLQRVLPSTQVDTAWAEQQRKQIDAETQRLESELKGYKNNLIKESIRMGTEELGAHYHASGDLANAQKAYAKMREYCTTPKHLAEMSLRLALLHVSQRNYLALHQAAMRIQQHQLPKPDAARLEPALPPLLGLAALASGDYRAAAAQFLAADPAFIQPMEPVAGNVVLNRAALSPSDVATYGALCALATLPREALRSKCLENTRFRPFLELEAHLRRAVAAFVAGKYTSCLSALDAHRPDWLLDPHLARHVAPLLALVRRRSVLAYVRPFDRLDISGMAAAFHAAEADLSAELAELIAAGQLDARIDAHAHALVACRPAASAGAIERVDVAERALDAARRHERGMRLRLWRVRMLEAGLELRAPQGGKARNTAAAHAAANGEGDGSMAQRRMAMAGRAA